MTSIRTYSELITLGSFVERFRYLSLRGRVGEATFGDDRWMNQRFYTSTQWRNLRQHIIARDAGCDLAFPGHEIHGSDTLQIHHMNPMTLAQVEHGDEDILNPEYLITTRLRTHNAIHYGDETLLPRDPVVRRPGDHVPWRN